MKKAASLLLVIIAMAVFVPSAMAQQPANPTPAQGDQTGEMSPLAAAPQLYDRALNAFDSQNFERAILDISLYLLVNPTDNRAYLLRAISYVQSDDIDAAADDLTQAITLTAADREPDFAARLYFLRGSLYSETESFDAAIADYNQSIAIAPSADAYTSRGLVYFTTQDLDSALNDFDEAIALDATDPILFYYRAAVNAQMGNGAASAADYVEFFDLVGAERRPANDPLLSGEPEVFPLTAGTLWTIPFEGREGQLLSVLALGRPDSGVDPVLVLLDPNGEPLTADDDSADDPTGLGALLLGYPLPETGMYTLLVAGTLASQEGEALIGIELLDP